MNKALSILAGVALLAFGMVGAYWLAGQQADRRVASRVETSRAALLAALDSSLAHLGDRTATLASRFEAVDDLKTAQERSLRRYRNADHLAAARALGAGGRISGMEEVRRLVDAARLVELEDGPAYVIQELDYSVAFVTPDAAALLDEIGARFRDSLAARGLPRYQFVISSVLRTAENQQDLRRINPNATSGVSTHEFGTTLDIVYHKYRYAPQPGDALPPSSVPVLDARVEPLRVQAYEALGMRYWQELQGLLGRVLIGLQNEGKVRVTLEREQPVFHITVARRRSD